MSNMQRGNGTKMHVVALRASPEEMRALQNLKRKSGLLSYADVLRLALRKAHPEEFRSATDEGTTR